MHWLLSAVATAITVRGLLIVDSGCSSISDRPGGSLAEILAAATTASSCLIPCLCCLLVILVRLVLLSSKLAVTPASASVTVRTAPAAPAHSSNSAIASSSGIGAGVNVSRTITDSANEPNDENAFASKILFSSYPPSFSEPSYNIKLVATVSLPLSESSDLRANRIAVFRPVMKTSSAAETVVIPHFQSNDKATNLNVIRLRRQSATSNGIAGDIVRNHSGDSSSGSDRNRTLNVLKYDKKSTATFSANDTAYSTTIIVPPLVSPNNSGGHIANSNNNSNNSNNSNDSHSSQFIERAPKNAAANSSTNLLILLVLIGAVLTTAGLAACVAFHYRHQYHNCHRNSDSIAGAPLTESSSSYCQQADSDTTVASHLSSWKHHQLVRPPLVNTAPNISHFCGANRANSATATVPQMLALESNLERERCALRDRQVRLHSVNMDLELDLPPNIQLPDGEEIPYGSSNRLHIRDPEQESEIYKNCIRGPPNRTIHESECSIPYRSNSAGLLSLNSSTTSSSGSSNDWGHNVIRCHSMSTRYAGTPHLPPIILPVSRSQRHISSGLGKITMVPCLTNHSSSAVVITSSSSSSRTGNTANSASLDSSCSSVTTTITTASSVSSNQKIN